MDVLRHSWHKFQIENNIVFPPIVSGLILEDKSEKLLTRIYAAVLGLHTESKTSTTDFFVHCY